MTFLELCKQVREGSGLSGDGPVSVDGQTGIQLKVVNWVRRAERDILLLHDDWQFLRTHVTSALVSGTHRYTGNSLGMVDARVLRAVYIDGQPIHVLTYDAWLDDVIKYGDTTKTGDPQYVTLTPDQRLQFWPVPVKANVVVVDYYKLPTYMTQNSSVSVIPAIYHDAIAAKALMYYSDYEEDMYHYERGRAEYDRWLSQLVADQLPESDFNRGIFF